MYKTNGKTMLTAHGDEVREQILKGMIDYIKEHGYSPSFREIGEMVGLSSTSTIHRHIHTMLSLGMLETDFKQGSGASRALRVPGYKFVKVVDGLE